MDYLPTDTLQLTLAGTLETLLAVIRKTPGIDLGCRPHFIPLPNGEVQTSCFATATGLVALQAAAGISVEIQRNATADGKTRQAEVQRTLVNGTRLRGMGAAHELKTPPVISPSDTASVISAYLATNLVEDTIGQITAQYPSLCQRITLPNKTVDANTVTMMRIGKIGTTKKRGVLFSGCAHAREWGGAEICLNLAMDLLAAYTTGGGITYGAVSYTAAQVIQIVETVDLFILPCINPDGRTWSQSVDPLWRKNRNGPGVDLNRNHDFLWNFELAFDPAVANGGSPGVTTVPASNDPSSLLYCGTAPDSEQETKNVVWIFDTYPGIGWFIDIHSFTGDVLYSWGDAPDQTSNPAMTFLNPAYNRKRGVIDASVYGEYLPLQDFNIITSAAATTTAAINAVRGQTYQSHQDYFLEVSQNAALGSYPTSGAVDDYAYSRHFVNASKPKIYAFTLEFGLSADFHPPFPEMGNIIQDIDSGLIAFSLFQPDYCAALQTQVDNAQDNLQTVIEALNDGEIPEPRTPANIAGVRKQIAALTQQLRALERELATCRKSNSN